MHHLKILTLTCATLIAVNGTGDVAQAADRDDWKISITPRIVAKPGQEPMLKHDTKTVVFAAAQDAQPEAVPPAVPEEAAAAPPATSNELPVIRPRIKPEQAQATIEPNYTDVYKSIPFSRAEYLANPSYRHEAALSLILGQPVITNGPKTVEPRVKPTQQYLPWSRATFGGSYLYQGYFGPYYGPFRYGF